MLAALRRHRVALLANILLWPLFAFIAIKQVAPRYTAVGTLVYEPSEYKVRELQSILQADPTTEAVMASQAEILRGLRVVQRVAERGNLYDNPEFNPALRPHGHLRSAIEAVHGLVRTAPASTASGGLRRSNPRPQPRRHLCSGAGGIRRAHGEDLPRAGGHVHRHAIRSSPPPR